MAKNNVTDRTASTGRIASLVLGIWLFVSAFLWPRTDAQMTNTWIVGALVVLVSLLAASKPQIQYANTALAVWLFLSVWILPTAVTGTVWNNLLVAIGLLVASLAHRVPGGRFEQRAHA